jgi:hypothetical protein
MLKIALFIDQKKSVSLKRDSQYSQNHMDKLNPSIKTYIIMTAFFVCGGKVSERPDEANTPNIKNQIQITNI